jgi:hypothetical protein
MVRGKGIEPVLGTLENQDCLASAARAADIIVNAASADHKGKVRSSPFSVRWKAAAGRSSIRLTGSGIVGTPAGGHRSDVIYDEDTPLTASTARKARVEHNDFILSDKTKRLRPIIVCPPMIMAWVTQRHPTACRCRGSSASLGSEGVLPTLDRVRISGRTFTLMTLSIYT